MSIDRLQEKIRKVKNPSVISFDTPDLSIPPHILRKEQSIGQAYGRFCMELMDGLKGIVPAVRFSFDRFALCGTEGLVTLEAVLNYGKKCGYYVILDGPQALSAQSAEFAASALLSEDAAYRFDGLCLCSYIGSDGLKPYIERLDGHALFVAIRTGNRTAPEVQDLLTGSRLVHTAMADIVKRLGEGAITKSGYSQIAGIGAATSGDSLKTLRKKYPGMFLMLDGYDYPNGNAKICSYAFDQFGHGAIACAGSSVTGAWIDAGSRGEDYMEQAVEAAKRMKKNLLRYITIL